MNLDVTYQGPVQRGFNGTHTLSIGIGTLTFWENFTGARYDVMKHGVEATFTFDKFTLKTEV